MSGREIDGTVLTLAPSGWTYELQFVLFDYETESLWFHLRGVPGLTCIGGVYADSTLHDIPFEKTV